MSTTPGLRGREMTISEATLAFGELAVSNAILTATLSAGTTAQPIAAPIDHRQDVLEQAASLALQFTAAPRDYLGPATPAMKEQAALGERLAAAIRALHVTAAPQVATDERQAFENKFPGVCSHWNGQNYGDNRCQRMWEVWQARADLAAAPVQAKEPFMFGIMGPDGKAHIDENCVAGDKDSTALHIEVNCLNDSPDAGYSIVPLYRAPVQPVAVPDEREAFESAFAKTELADPNAEPGKDYALARASNGDYEANATHAAWIMWQVALAAPAAQGDAISQQQIAEIIDSYTDQGTKETSIDDAAEAILAAIAAKAAA